MTDMRSEALAYAGRGWPVFPLHSPAADGRCSCGHADCASPAKHPRTPRGLKDATTDPGQIQAWWSKWPDANIGAVTGAVWDVIDTDGAEGIAEWLRWCDANEVDASAFPRSVTGRLDGGRHVFVARTGGGNRTNLLPHVDFRSDGGYVILPPSRHISGNTYEWKVAPNGHVPPAPEALIELLAAPRATPLPAPGHTTTGTDIHPWAAQALKNEIARIALAASGTGNDQLNLSAYALGQIVGGGALDEEFVRESLFRAATGNGRRGANEARATIDSGISSGKLEKRYPPVTTHARTWRPTVVPTPVQDAPDVVTAGSRSMADVEAEDVEWLWRGRIPLGKLTLLDGNPGLGKSILHIDLAARVSSGRTMPDGSATKHGNVLLMVAEDGLGDTIQPRLVAAGADLTRISAYGDDRIPLIPQELEEIEAEVVRRHVVLLVLDPLFAFVDAKARSISDQEMRQQAMTPLAQIAKRTGAAILIVRHLSKDTRADAIARGAGSMGIIGASRSAMLVGIHPDNPDQVVLAPTKSNLAARASSLAFSIRQHDRIEAPVIHWHGEVSLTADQLLSRPPDEEERGALAEAKEFLVSLLGDHIPQTVSDIQSEARKAGVTPITLRRAKDALGLHVSREGFGRGGRWTWQITPGTPAETDDPADF